MDAAEAQPFEVKVFTVLKGHCAYAKLPFVRRINLSRRFRLGLLPEGFLLFLQFWEMSAPIGGGCSAEL